MEKWLPVVGYESLYEVSNRGRVRTIKTGRMKKPTLNKAEKRFYLMLWKENKYKLCKVHRIVLSAFKGECPNGMESCHNDGDATNNNVENLRWDTPSNNQRDRVRHGTSNRGERCAASKLTEKQVRAILADDRLQREIAADYGVQESQISRIKTRVRWGHLQLP